MPSTDEIRRCLEVLEALREFDPNDPSYLAVERAAAHLTKSAKKKRRRRRREQRAVHDQSVLASTVRTACYFLDESPRVNVGDNASTDGGGVSSRELIGTRLCYVCKIRFDLVDTFYHSLCPECASTNRAQREMPIDVDGRVALVTGGRIKIGFEIGARLLRGGATVTVTTRFPRDAAARYARLADYESIRDRLEIVGIDFRDVRGLVSYIEERGSGAPLDILINNAAQTIRRPAAYYRELAAGELEGGRASGQLSVPSGSREALTRFHQSCADEASPEFPLGRYDIEGLQLDLREANSWTKRLTEVGPAELLETHLVTAVAPFLLCGGLKAAMLRSSHPDRYIVNVSAMEGVFNYAKKTSRHPHTNMAKAALNMLTRTAAADYEESGIHMVAVDTGWITDENPEPQRADSGFCPPLDLKDGAARVLAPIIAGIGGNPVSGVFLKDYKVAPW